MSWKSQYVIARIETALIRSCQNYQALLWLFIPVTRNTKLTKKRVGSKLMQKQHNKWLFISFVLISSSVRSHWKLTFVSDLSHAELAMDVKNTINFNLFYLKCSPIYLFLDKARNLNREAIIQLHRWIRRNRHDETTSLLSSQRITLLNHSHNRMTWVYQFSLNLRNWEIISICILVLMANC